MKKNKLLLLAVILSACSNDLDDYMSYQQYEGWFTYVEDQDEYKVFSSYDYNSILIIYNDFELPDITIGTAINMRLPNRSNEMYDGMTIVISSDMNKESRMKASVLGIRYVGVIDR